MRLINLAAGAPVATVLTSACAQPEPAPQADTRAADEAAIRAASAEWLEGGQSKDAARFTSFFSGDGR